MEIISSAPKKKAAQCRTAFVVA